MRTWSRRLALALGLGVALLAILIAWQWRSDLPLATLQARWATGASQFIDVDAISVHYRDEGTGPAIVLLHGTGASLHAWDAWTSALTTDGHRVVRIDLPAFGLTGPNPRGDYSVGAYLGFLEHFASRVGLRSFVLGGNSFGGELAWRYAAAHPEQVSALILVDASGYPPAGPPPLVVRLGRIGLVRRLAAHLDPRWISRAALHEIYGDPSRVTAPLIDRYTELALRPGNRAAFAARAATPFEDRTSELRHLRLPVLILWGGRDRNVPVADGRRFAADLAGAELHIYDSLGHAPMQEDGARTVVDVKAFLAASAKQAAR